MLKQFLAVGVMLANSITWAQSPPVPPPSVTTTADEQTQSSSPSNSQDQQPSPAADTDKAATTGADDKAATTGTDNKGSWSILGNGYAELKSATDARAAFSLALIRNDGDKNQLALGVSRGSEANTLSGAENFASFVLSPETSSWSAYLKYDRWNFKRNTFVWGWYANGILGSASWQVAMDPALPDELTSKIVVALALSGGLSIGYSKATGPNALRILGHLGLNSRTLLGDVWSDDAFLQAAIGRSQRQFVGMELGFWIQLNTIAVGMNFPIVAGHVPGLTNGQFLPSVSVGGKIDLGSIQ